MIESHLKIAFRSFKKNKVFYFINLLRPATVLFCFLLIAIFVYNELSYYKYFATAKSIAVLMALLITIITVNFLVNKSNDCKPCKEFENAVIDV